MEQLINITAAYSNAVLLAVITNVSDFASKLDLPIHHPVTASQVQKFQPYPFKGLIGGALTLTNGYRFWHGAMGYVDIFRAPTNYFFMPDEWGPEDYYKVTNYWGQMRMTTNDVIEFARDAIRKLGFDPKDVHADGPPTAFDGPHEFQGKTVPYCDVEWKGPKARQRDIIRIQVNADKRQLVYLSLNSTNAWREPPKLNVEPQLITNSLKRMPSPIFSRTNAPARRPIPPRPDR